MMMMLIMVILMMAMVMLNSGDDEVDGSCSDCCLGYPSRQTAHETKGPSFSIS